MRPSPPGRCAPQLAVLARPPHRRLWRSDATDDRLMGGGKRGYAAAIPAPAEGPKGQSFGLSAPPPPGNTTAGPVVDGAPGEAPAPKEHVTYGDPVRSFSP